MSISEILPPSRRETALRHARHYARIAATVQQLYGEGMQKVGLVVFDRERANIDSGRRWASDNAANLEVANIVLVHTFAMAAVSDLRYDARIDLIPQLEIALRAAQRLGSRRAEITILNLIGNAHISLGENRRALDLLNGQVLTPARLFEDQHNVQGALAGLGSAHSALGDLPTAIRFHEQALTLAQTVGDQHAEGTALSNLGLAYAKQGDPQTAIGFHKQALTLIQTTGDQNEECKILNNLGLAYVDAGDMQTAIRFYEQALALARELDDKRSEGIILSHLGGVYINLGDERQAIVFNEQSLNMARVIRNRRGEGTALDNLGSSYLKLGDMHRAAEHFLQALAIAHELEDRRTEGALGVNLGIVHANLGDASTAINCYKRALTIARTIIDPYTETRALFHLGVIDASRGETHTAIDYYEQALALARKVGDRRAQAFVSWELGQTLMQLGDHERAKQLMQTHIDFLHSIGHPDAEQCALQLEQLQQELRITKDGEIADHETDNKLDRKGDTKRASLTDTQNEKEELEDHDHNAASRGASGKSEVLPGVFQEPRSHIPSLGIRFDISKVDSGSYGVECWKVFWRAVDITRLRNVSLLEGDTEATLHGVENVYCIGVQSFNTNVLDEVRVALEQSTEFQQKAAFPRFFESDQISGEPLVIAGRIDSMGNLVGEAYNARPTLDEVQKEKQQLDLAKKTSILASGRTKPASMVFNDQATSASGKDRSVKLANVKKQSISLPMATSMPFRMKPLEDEPKTQEPVNSSFLSKLLSRKAKFILCGILCLLMGFLMLSVENQPVVANFGALIAVVGFISLLIGLVVDKRISTPPASYAPTSQPPSDQLKIVRCSNCRKELKKIEDGLFRNVSELDTWFGNVCLRCKYIYCADCIQVGGPTPCRRCGTPSQAAMRLYLQEIGALQGFPTNASHITISQPRASSVSSDTSKYTRKPAAEDPEVLTENHSQKTGQTQPRSSLKQVQGILILTRHDLTNNHAQILLGQIIEQQRSNGHSIAADLITKVHVAAENLDDAAYEYMCIRMDLSILGEHELLERTRVFTFQASDGSTGKYFIVFDRS